jgi:hypothetical protein
MLGGGCAAFPLPHLTQINEGSWKEIMSKTITLPITKAQVVLRDPKTLKVKDRRKVFEAANGQEGLMQSLNMVDGLIAILVESWTLDLIIPSVMLSSLGEMELADYDALAKEAQDAQSLLFPDFTQDLGADSPLDKSLG